MWVILLWAWGNNADKEPLTDWDKTLFIWIYIETTLQVVAISNSWQKSVLNASVDGMFALSPGLGALALPVQPTSVGAFPFFHLRAETAVLSKNVGYFFEY